MVLGFFRRRHKREHSFLWQWVEFFKEVFEQLRASLHYLASEVAALKESVASLQERARAQESENSKARDLPAKVAKLESDATRDRESLERLSATVEKLTQALGWAVGLSTQPSRQPQQPSTRPQHPLNLGPESGLLLQLTYREKAILGLFLDSGMPLTYEEIGSRLGIRPSTVRTHVQSLRAKGVPLTTVNTSPLGKKWLALPKALLERILGKADDV